MESVRCSLLMPSVRDDAVLLLIKCTEWLDEGRSEWSRASECSSRALSFPPARLMQTSSSPLPWTLL